MLTPNNFRPASSHFFPTTLCLGRERTLERPATEPGPLAPKATTLTTGPWLLMWPHDKWSDKENLLFRQKMIPHWSHSTFVCWGIPKFEHFLQVDSYLTANRLLQNKFITLQEYKPRHGLKAEIEVYRLSSVLIRSRPTFARLGPSGWFRDGWIDYLASGSVQSLSVLYGCC